MKCNKCGTPIIPGENNCRICGNKTDFSERVKEPEIIDFPMNLIEEKEAAKEVIIDLPDLNNIIDIEEKQTNSPDNTVELSGELIQEPSEPAALDFLTEQVSNLKQPIDLEPPLAETTTNKAEKPASEVIEEEIVEDTKSNKKKVLDKVNEKGTKQNQAKKIKKEKKSSGTVVVLLAILLLCSLALNTYLFIMDGNAKASGTDEVPETQQTYSKVSYDDYKITIPSTWITKNGNNNLLIYDDTQNWSASMQIINEADYEVFTANKESLVESLGNLRYQFTSNYSKDVEGKEFHLFKGKYYDYSVYVIVTELDTTNMLFVDLKFKGEVDDTLLNNILKTMTDVKENDIAELFKDNFEFQDISTEIKSASQKTEE